MLWHIKSTQVYLVKHKDGKASCPIPTDRTYWLILAWNAQTGESKYFVSNAPAGHLHSWQQKTYVCEYYQQRNEASYASRRKIAKAKEIEFL